MSAGSDEGNARFRRGLALRIGLTLSVLGLGAYLARGSLRAIAASLARLDAGAFVAGLVVMLVAFSIGTLRWRLALGAYGASKLPTFASMFRVTLVGHFYNTFLPGNVGGDALRGHLSRDALEGGGSYVAVIIDRAFGLAGLLLLASTTLLFHPIEGAKRLPLLAGLGVAAAIAAAFAPIVGRRLGAFVPGRIGSLLSKLPTVARPAYVVALLALSVTTQFLCAFAAHLALASLDSRVGLAESVVLVPIALVATYVPTIAGLGTLQFAFVVLFASVGVSKADATATAFAYQGLQLTLAVLGGVLSLVRGTHLEAPRETDAP